MSREDVADTLEDVGFHHTVAERISKVAWKAFLASGALDRRHLRLARSHPVGNAMLRLAEFYGTHDGDGTREDFLEDEVTA